MIIFFINLYHLKGFKNIVIFYILGAAILENFFFSFKKITSNYIYHLFEVI